MDELLTYPAVFLARLIRERRISSRELMGMLLHHVEEVNPRLNAVVQFNPKALADARRADEKLAQGGTIGALHGVPFTVKDVIETAGIVSAAGMRERSTTIPDRDATVVSRLKAAGGVLLGRTNCPPGGGGGETDNPVYGRTNNPYDPERTPGGSSGGCAAVVAACGSPLSIGSDSGGSLRIPAAFCGVATLKPTSGRVPNTGIVNHPGGLSDIRTQVGPLARRVEDLWLAYRVISGEDGVDAGVVNIPPGEMEKIKLRGLRIAYYTGEEFCSPAAEVVSMVNEVAAGLKAAGVRVRRSQPACLDRALEITRRYWRMEELSGKEVVQLFADWDDFRRDLLAFMQDVDVLLCPAAPFPAPPHGGDDDGRFCYTLAYSLGGYPAAVVRAGASPEGLPIGVQVVARPWREDVALAVAARIERLFGGWQPPAQK